MRIFIDVRTKEEFEEGSFEGAISLPLNEVGLFVESTDLPKDTEIVVFCASGGRSNIAQKIFKKAGFTNVINCINKDGAKCLC